MSVGRGDPAQNPVRDDKVEFGQVAVGPAREVCERALGQTACALDVCRVEVEAPDLGLRASRGDHDRGNPIPATEIGVAKGPAQIRRPMAHQESGHRQPGRGHLPVERERVADIRYVTVIPAGHGGVFSLFYD
jgi:hypothetical protein